jgi:phage protein D
MGFNRDNPRIGIAFPEANIDAVTEQILKQRLISLKYIDEESKMDKCELVFNNQDLLFIDAEVLRKGSILTIDWGYGDVKVPARNMVVKKIKGWSTVTVELASPSMIMATKKRNRTFENQTRSGVVTTIAEENGFKELFRFVESTEEVFETILQANESDASFLARLARKEGFEFWIDHTGFHWHERILDQKPIRTIEYLGPGLGDIIGEPVLKNDITLLNGRVTVKGKDSNPEKESVATNETDQNRDGLASILEVVDPELAKVIGIQIQSPGIMSVADAVSFVDKNKLTGTFKAAAFLGATGQTFRGSPEERLSGLEVLHGTEKTKEGLDKRAKAKFRKNIREAIKMEITMVGDPLVGAKQVVELVGFGQRCSQKYYIKKVTHEIGGGNGYRMVLEVVSDGHGGHSTTGDSSLEIPIPKKSGASTNDISKELRKLAGLVSGRVASEGNDGAAGSLSLLVNHALAQFSQNGLSSSGQVRTAANNAIQYGVNKGDAELRDSALALNSLLNQAVTEEQKSSAKLNKKSVVTSPLALEAISRVNPETAKEEIRYVDRSTGTIIEVLDLASLRK